MSALREPVELSVQLIPHPIERVKRDIRAAARTLSDAEARYLVDLYYQVQEFRKASGNQARSLGKDGEPNTFILWVEDNMDYIETQIKGALDKYTDAQPVGRWAKSITGVGPVIAAGLLAHIDITQAPTVGHIWRYAGLDPTVTWDKGQKRPWNADLKVLCWKIGESFVKCQNNEHDHYGAVYVKRKAEEQLRNERGEYREQAERALAQKRIGKDTDAYAAYSQGKLPPAHLHARAKRYAVKLFLSHLHHVMYESHYGAAPPKPYVIEHLGHAHLLTPPNWP